MENNKENQELVKNKIIPCCWSEVDANGKHITNCTNTPTFRDEDNHQIRYFCAEHLKKVKEIRYQMYLKMKEKYEPNSKQQLYNQFEEAIKDKYSIITEENWPKIKKQIENKVIKEYEEKLLFWLDNLPSCWNGTLYYPDMINMLKKGTFKNFLDEHKQSHDNVVAGRKFDDNGNGDFE